MKICQGLCNSSNYPGYKCSGTVKRVLIEGWSETFLYCDTAITICRKAYNVTIIDSDDIDCEISNSCTCDISVIMLRGCQCGGK